MKKIKIKIKGFKKIKVNFKELNKRWKIKIKIKIKREEGPIRDKK